MQYSVVIPAYNEQANLRELLEQLHPVLEGLGEAYEIVVVDDGSDDGSAALLEELRGRYPALRVVRLTSRSGQTAAFAAGFDAARGEWVITMDADLQNNPADIPRLIEQVPGYDLVCGVRRQRRDSWVRRFSSRFANRFRRAFTDDGISDIGCSLKLFRRRDLATLPRFDGMHRFYPTWLRWRGCRVVEVDVDHRPRRAGESKYNVRNRALRALADLLAVRWMWSRRLDYRVEQTHEDGHD